MSMIIQILNLILPIIQRNIYNYWGETDKIGRWIIFMLICGIGIGVFEFAQTTIRNSVNTKIQEELQLRLMRNGIECSNDIIKTRGAGAYLVSVYGDCEQIAAIISSTYIWTALLSVAEMAVLFAVTISWTPTFVIIVCSLYVITIMVIMICGRISKSEFKIFRAMLTKINPKVLEFLDHRLTVLGYMGIGRSEQILQKMFKERDKHVVKSCHASGISLLTISWCSLLGQIILLAISAYQIAMGQITVGDIVALISYMTLAFTPITAIKNVYDNYSHFGVLEERIHDCLDVRGKGMILSGEGYSFDRCTVSHQTEEAESPLFHNFSHRFCGVTGIVGLSGGGKTSLIKTMTGSLSPQEGKCCFGGKDVSDISNSMLLSFVRYFPQEPEIFDENLEYNITLGKRGITDKEYKKCLSEKMNEMRCAGEKLSIRKLINEEFKLVISEEEAVALQSDERVCIALAEHLMRKNYYIKEKYDCLIERLNLESLYGRKLGVNGTCISGGERSRVALARFLLPVGATFFIMDEPFSNVDIFTLKAGLDTFSEFQPCNDGIVISHNMQIIRELCEGIMVIEEGKICYGKSEEMENNNCFYRKLLEEYYRFNSNVDIDVLKK